MLTRLLTGLWLVMATFTTHGANTVVLWDFDNNTVGPMASIQAVEHLSRQLPAALLSKLSSQPELRVVERDRLRDIIAEQGLGSSALANESTRLRLGRMLGAHTMVFGDYIALGKIIRADIRMVNVETSEVLFSAPLVGSEDDLMKNIGSIADKVERHHAQYRGGQATSALSFEALSAYEEGVKHMQGKRYDEAIYSFQRVLQHHPGHAGAERELLHALEKQSRSN
jgi:curli biogenesis system outer membrane secretion channel CsgG